MPTAIEEPTEILRKRWEDLRAAEPHLRIRNAASRLGVSELELLATRTGAGAVRLRPDFRDLLAEVHTLGRVMALTRNEHVVHERKGTYANPTLEGHVWLFLGPEIDLRIFPDQWAEAFAVEEEGQGTVRHSLQFFAKDGGAVHKIYLTGASDKAAYDALVHRFRAEDRSAMLNVRPAPAPRPERPDAEIDAAGFQQGWRDLKDTHDFYQLLRKFGVSRTQALRLAPEGDFAVRVTTGALRYVLGEAHRRTLPIMLFVGNPGMLQIHSGEVGPLVDARGWMNILDRDLNLHVREEAIAQCWVVRKPTVDGIVTALECYDATGEMIIQVFGRRKPGIPELNAWRTLMWEVEKAMKA
ncbi:MAG: hemin-degrading factor [Flavobacteriales bacterium]|nr:hemin-degrading factor [Flavobacteriales bacterium]MCB9167507.1 hemin-degrading factor [Flavobacteriales bacterium]